jgi:hypothetical protein
MPQTPLFLRAGFLVSMIENAVCLNISTKLQTVHRQDCSQVCSDSITSQIERQCAAGAQRDSINITECERLSDTLLV